MLLLIYSLISGVTMTLLWGAFRLSGLRRRTHHGLTRALLVATVAASLLLPFTAFIERPASTTPTGAAITVTIVPVAIESVDAATPTPTPTATAVDYGALLLKVLPKVYLAGLCGTAIWLLIGLANVTVAIAGGQRRRLDDRTTIVVHNRDITPFTWGRWIVISAADLKDNSRIVLNHEQAHLAAKHWTDLLLCRIAACVNWYWPTAWLLTRDLAEVHEFEADRRVVNSGTPATEYQMLLIAKGSGDMMSRLVNPFNYYSLKTRITMMQTKLSPARSRMRGLAMIPAVALALWLVGSPEVASAINSARPEKPAANLIAVANEQPDEDKTATDDPIYTAVEVMPMFPGGETEIYKFLSKNCSYPAKASPNNIQGRVVVQFVVEKDGSIGEVKVVRSVDPDLDKEAMRVVKSMPKFIPGKMNGQNVRCWYALPVMFQLNKSAAEQPEESDVQTAEHESGPASLYNIPSSPLIFLDGVEITQEQLNQVPAENIHSIEIIKDSRTLKQYGERGANGVLKVETKNKAANSNDGCAARFDGGDDAMYQFVANNIRYPEEAAKADIQGIVTLNVEILKDGSIGKIDVADNTSGNQDLADEAIRVTRLMPKFIPALYHGQPVNSYVKIPFSFKMN